MYLQSFVWADDAAPVVLYFFFQAEDGIRDLVRSRGLGDVYKRQILDRRDRALAWIGGNALMVGEREAVNQLRPQLVLSLIHI